MDFRPFLVGLTLVCGAATVSRAQSPAAPAAPASAPAPAPAAGPAAAEAVAISCPERGPFGPGTAYYSQFYEDYILSYVFRDVAKGTYVDVGAYDPDTGSVTKYFYLKGWRGVNVEPNPEHLAALQKGRPEDANLGVGISDAAATLTFYKFEKRASGLSTFDPETAARHKKAGYSYEELTIPLVTLSEALGRVEVVKGGFDFLNVDVEGFERKVLTGLDFAKNPPKVIVLEATAPMTEEPTQQKWEDILFANGYSFALDDGLNRYYVQRSQRPLQGRFLEVAYCVARDKLSKGVKLDGFQPEPVK
jgi:FkbM family methyltransferase